MSEFFICNVKHLNILRKPILSKLNVDYFCHLVSRQLSKCLLQLLRDRLVFLLLEHQIILKTVDLQVRMIFKAKAFVGENM